MTNPYIPGDVVRIMRGACTGQVVTVKVSYPFASEKHVFVDVLWPGSEEPSETVYLPEEVEPVDAP